MRSAILGASKVCTHRHATVSDIAASRRNAFHRRLSYEPLEERQLLSVGVSGRVWNDLNTSGIQDPGKPGVAGAAIELFSTTDDIIGNGDDVSRGVAVSDANGNYAFSGLPDGLNYFEVFHTPVGYTFTTQNVGSDDAVDSDPDATGVTALFTVPADQTDTTRDAGLVGAAPGFGWALRAGATGSNGNRATAVTTDASGNVYVTGTFRATTDFDPGPGSYNLTCAGHENIYVAKYSSTGAIVWAKGWGAAADAGQAITSDGIAVGMDGSIYTSGHFYGTLDFDPGPDAFNLYGDDFAFISKLDSAGNFVWAQVPGNSYNAIYVTDIAAAADGSVCTVMSSTASVRVSKVDATGNTVWVTDLGTTTDPNKPTAQDIAVAADGSVCITGKFFGTVNFAPVPGSCQLTSVGDYNAFVCKLDCAGNFAWAKSVGGTGVTYGEGIAIGTDGDVYTTGSFYGTIDFDPGADIYDLTSDAYSHDGFAAKLDSAGSFVWAEKVGKTPVGIAVGTDGSVYAMGTTVCKLSSAGNILWIKDKGGSEIAECVHGTALGPDDSVYTAGEFQGNIDFDLGSGTFYLTSSGSYDAFVAKLQPYFVPSDLTLSATTIAEGQPAETVVGDFSTADAQPGATFTYTLVSGDNSADNNSFAIVDNRLCAKIAFNAGAKNSYAIRVRTTDPEGFFFEKEFVIAISTVDTAHTFSLGGLAWKDLDRNGIQASGETGIAGEKVKLFWSPNELAEDADDVLLGTATTDAAGRYRFSELLAGANYYLVFQPLPEYTFTTQGAGGDDACDSDADNRGTTTLVTAPTGDFDGKCDVGFVQVPDLGFVRSIGGSYNTISHGESVTTDASGNVYVTGYFQGQADLGFVSAGNSDIFVVKYSATGQRLWAKSFGGPDEDWGTGITVATNGDVYVTGFFSGAANFDPGLAVCNLTSAGDNDVFVVKLDSFGNLVWARSMGGSGDDQAYGIALAPDGNVYATGYFQGTADFDPGPEAFTLTGYAGYNAFVSKLDSAGNFIWAKTMAGTDRSRAYAIAVGADGSVFTTGCFSGTIDFDPGSGTFSLACIGYDAAFVSKLDSDGNFVWANGISETIDERMYGIAVGADGYVYTTGHSWLTADGSGPIMTGLSDTILCGSASDQDTFNMATAVAPETANPTSLSGISGVIVCKLNSTTGDFVWIKGMGEAGHSEGVGVAVGADGNIYTTGRFEGRVDFDPGAGAYNLDSFSDYAAFVSVLDSGGNLVWASSIDRSGDLLFAGISVGLSIATTADKNVYTTGYFGGTADFAPGPDTYNLTSHGSRDVFVCKLLPIHGPTDTIGLFAPTISGFFLRNSNDSGYADTTFGYGPANAGWKPISGDWNRDGTSSVGLYNPMTSVFFLRNTNDAGYADVTFAYGPANADWLPVAGDWDGDGKDTIGLYNPITSVFYLRNTNDAGYADLTFAYGPANAGWLPIVGDWNGNGKDTVGLYDPTTSVFYLRNTNDVGYADVTFPYGAANAGWLPLAGDWSANGTDTVGLFNPTTSAFFLRNTNDSGYADLTFAYGPANAGWTPIVSDWNGSSGSPLRAAGGATAADTTAPPLTASALQPLAAESIARWTAAGVSANLANALGNVQVVVTDLPGSMLGLATRTTVYIDRDAAGHGWFIDPTPAVDEEFSPPASNRQLQAVAPQAMDQIDLLTVLEHELGHIAGLSDLDVLTDDVMSGVLGVGIRRNASHVDVALASLDS